MMENLLNELDTVLAEWSPPYPQDAARLRRLVDDARAAQLAEPAPSAAPNTARDKTAANLLKGWLDYQWNVGGGFGVESQLSKDSREFIRIESRPTVRAKRPVQQRKGATVPALCECSRDYGDSYGNVCAYCHLPKRTASPVA